MTRMFGILPWDVERLTYDEFTHYRNALLDLADEASAKQRLAYAESVKQGR